ncbi:hypothetical protein GLAREA_05868 [Glarea lozoyensis ATCC 20868]|uniref:Uncharacterized protein n=1 Tax=Glarea lozoyensis (strain ATCC 20868 / MF5171) TaxID=1116229 RepID=S3DLE7_GLAL2|nr:uncharacterized protein GLAREA_05868 [Glarea lozoyensis ATCC 20868]EPE32856.1 hypothetical protein GLAREA_05868 [Glarea lozoyensis ATCC 20868]
MTSKFPALTTSPARQPQRRTSAKQSVNANISVVPPPNSGKALAKQNDATTPSDENDRKRKADEIEEEEDSDDESFIITQTPAQVVPRPHS